MRPIHDVKAPNARCPCGSFVPWQRLENAQKSLRHSGVALTLLRTLLWPLARDSTLQLRVRLEYVALRREVEARGWSPGETEFLYVQAPYDETARHCIEKVSSYMARGYGRPTGAVIAMCSGEPQGVWAFKQVGEDMYGCGGFVVETARGRGLLGQMLAVGLAATDVESPGRGLILAALTNRPVRRALSAAGFVARRIVVTGALPGKKPRRAFQWERTF